MFGLQPLHIIAILALALLIFGPSQLPNIARALGRSINEFRHSATTMSDELKKGLEEKPEEPADKAALPKSDV